MKPCPFCGATPDPDNPQSFGQSDDALHGFVVCCCDGPEVATDFQDWPAWRDAAIAAWNRRVVPASEAEVAKLLRDFMEALDASAAADTGADDVAAMLVYGEVEKRVRDYLARLTDPAACRTGGDNGAADPVR